MRFAFQMWIPTMYGSTQELVEVQSLRVGPKMEDETCLQGRTQCFASRASQRVLGKHGRLLLTSKERWIGHGKENMVNF